MRNFDYFDKPCSLYTPKIMKLITKIYEYKGRQDLFLESYQDKLSPYIKVARLQSIAASNRIESIYASDTRIDEIANQNQDPKGIDEEQIAGYKDVLATVEDNFEYINLSSNVILQLHRDLYSYAGGGGRFKNTDNIIQGTDDKGKTQIRFKPVSAFETRAAMDELCSNFKRAFENKGLENLILIPMFIQDFLCIHPFDDGNGRMSRLLTNLLFLKSGFMVAKYVSLEMLIETSVGKYYEALLDSSKNWHEGANNYEPFVEYYLGILLKAYNEFEESRCRF